ncbi:hypothetical protein DXG03_002079 [Asterophora parasitica]|uniref:Protein kinase domain-containing protein n=1 Tax=Asterophora parasitica TaxID=117018 RepID=A0A9P7G8S5_9AGAR|nr:hypothetical protein DXG03_002079 [Asterophora parasitica]
MSRRTPGQRAPDFGLLKAAPRPAQGPGAKGTKSRRPTPDSQRQPSAAQPSPNRPDSQELADVLDFFDYSLPYHAIHPDHINSDSTRHPAPFDRHLDEYLKLKHVTHIPTFDNDLRKVADEALEAYLLSCDLPSTTHSSTGFPHKKLRETLLENSPHSTLQNEASVQQTYAQTIISHALVVASTLEFKLSKWSAGYLNWDTHKAKERGQAVADGFLTLIESKEKRKKQIMPPLSDEYRRLKAKFPTLGVWEFKSLRAGDLDVFKCMLELARMSDFPWTGCDCGEFCTIYHPNAAMDGAKTTWAKTGPDATTSQVCCGKRKVPKKFTPSAVKWLRHAKYIQQQIWAEMVKHDASFACLNAGRYELYMKRVRDTNTMYISDIIRTDAPGHGRLLTGFIIAALRDARDRSAQLDSGPLPLTWCNSNPFQMARTKLTDRELRSGILLRPWVAMAPETKASLHAAFVPDVPYVRTGSGLPPQKLPPFNADSFFWLVEMEQRSTTRAYARVSGTEYTGVVGRFASSLVVKHATNDRAVLRLKKEYQAYLNLQNAGVTQCIPDVVGFFCYTPTGGGPLVQVDECLSLVLEDVGDHSVRDEYRKGQGTALDAGLRDKCLQALKQLHDANFCYSSASMGVPLENIIIRRIKRHPERLGVVIVGLGGVCRPRAADEWKKAAEYQATEKKLQNVQKRGLEETDPDDVDPSE